MTREKREGATGRRRRWRQRRKEKVEGVECGDKKRAREKDRLKDVTEKIFFSF